MNRDELELIVSKLAEESKIKYEETYITLGAFFGNMSSFLVIVLLPLPLIIGNIMGDGGLLVGLMLYLLIVSFCLLLSKFL